MRRGVVLCGKCINLDLKRISSKISGAEVLIVNDCKVKVEYSFAVFGCPAIPRASGYSGNYEIVDLRLVESLFENPEDVASAWINSTLVSSEPEVEVVETGYDIVYEGDNMEIISELALNANVTVVTSNAETIRSLYPFRIRVIEGKIEEIRGKVGNFEVIVDGVDVVTGKRGKIAVKAGQVITPHAEEKEGIFTGDEYHAALKAVNNLGSFVRIKAVEIDHDVCGTAKSGIPGCSLCLSCPAGTIERHNDRLKINLESCTGCGFCAAVCPVSAIRNTILPSEVLLEKIDAAISVESERKVVAFVCQNALGDFYEMWRNGCEKLPAILPIVVPCINSVSEIHYLYAILRGADGVAAIPCECENLRYDALEVAKVTLEAFGFDGIRVAKVAELKDVDFGSVPGKLLDSPPEGKTKRQKWLYMVERLMVFPLQKDKFQIKQFGKIEIGDACTLCRACASFCPANAIIRDVENGRILFTHALCFACNLCVRVCPENAVKLENVLDFNSLAESVVFKDEIIRCPSCRKPHITGRAYERVKDISGMSAPLFFCPDCRPRVILESIYEEIVEEQKRREKL